MSVIPVNFVSCSADWTVYVADAAGTHAFASFHKYYDGPLPVYDIQTLVIH